MWNWVTLVNFMNLKRGKVLVWSMMHRPWRAPAGPGETILAGALSQPLSVDAEI